jgi:hypothetical protein
MNESSQLIDPRFLWNIFAKLYFFKIYRRLDSSYGRVGLYSYKNREGSLFGLIAGLLL